MVEENIEALGQLIQMPGVPAPCGTDIGSHVNDFLSRSKLKPDKGDRELLLRMRSIPGWQALEDNFSYVGRAEIRFLDMLEEEIARTGKLPVGAAENEKGLKVGRRTDEYLFKASRRTLPLVMSMYLDRVPEWREAVAATSPLIDALRRWIDLLTAYMGEHQGKLPPDGYVTSEGDKLGGWAKRNLVRPANGTLEWWLDEALSGVPGWTHAFEAERRTRRELAATCSVERSRSALR